MGRQKELPPLEASQITLMASQLRDLENQGLRLEESGVTLDSGTLKLLRAVAAGQLDPEIIVRFLGHRLLMNTLATLSMEDQQRILREKTVDLVARTPSGEIEVRKVPPEDLTRQQLKQVFSITRPKRKRKGA